MFTRVNHFKNDFGVVFEAGLIGMITPVII